VEPLGKFVAFAPHFQPVVHLLCLGAEQGAEQHAEPAQPQSQCGGSPALFGRRQVLFLRAWQSVQLGQYVVLEIELQDGCVVRMRGQRPHRPYGSGTAAALPGQRFERGPPVGRTTNSIQRGGFTRGLLDYMCDLMRQQPVIGRAGSEPDMPARSYRSGPQGSDIPAVVVDSDVREAVPEACFQFGASVAGQRLSSVRGHQ
jgi:hypothetical protein